METKTIREFQFVFKPSSVILVYQHKSSNPQYISFHNYHHQKKENMERFKDTIRQSRRITIDGVFSLARQNEIRPQASSSSSIDGQMVLAGGGKRVYW